MAMNVRLPSDLDAALTDIAQASRMSKHAAIIVALERFIREEQQTELVLASVDETLVEYRDALSRLADA